MLQQVLSTYCSTVQYSIVQYCKYTVYTVQVGDWLKCVSAGDGLLFFEGCSFSVRKCNPSPPHRSALSFGLVLRCQVAIVPCTVLPVLYRVPYSNLRQLSTFRSSVEWATRGAMLAGSRNSVVVEPGYAWSHVARAAKYRSRGAGVGVEPCCPRPEIS